MVHFSSAGVDPQSYQIKFVIVVFVLHFVARTNEFHLWDRDENQVCPVIIAVV